MPREGPTTIPNMKAMATIRLAINQCVLENDNRAVRALLRIRREQNWARPIDKWKFIIMGFLGPIMISSGLMWRLPGLNAYPLSAAVSIAWVLMIAHFYRRYPHRDEQDIPERREIDGMV